MARGELQKHDLWLLELSRQIFSRFTFDPADDIDPRWSHDGRHVVFASNRKGKFDLFQKSLSGSEEALLLESSENKFPDDYTKDGRYVLYRSRTGGNQSVWALPQVGDRQPIPVMTTPFTIDELQVSPDGRWIAYNLDETGRAEVYIQPFLTSGERIRISRHGGCQPKWRQDGKELFYLALDGTMMALEIKTGAALEPGVPQPLFQTWINVDPGIDQYAVTGDGQRFIVITPAEGQKPTPFNVVLNWTAALKK
jgi:Tol biopolymer transport system component